MRPYASAALDGIAILIPGMCMNHDSRLCECWGPMPIRATIGVRITSGTVSFPPVK